jgi:3',5'-cyclic AMP phosphodiesterase CpdA
MKIAHISDLHFSSSLFVSQWADNVIRIMDGERPDLLVVTGDLTNEGYTSEFEAAKDFLDDLKAMDRLVVPGNHDSRNLGYTIFEELIGSRFPVYEGNGVTVLGLDSTEPDLDDGHVGREHYGDIKERFQVRTSVSLHLTPSSHTHPGTGRERQIPSDAGTCSECARVGVDIVLSGHKHIPWIWKPGRLLLHNRCNRTTGVLKDGRGPPSGILSWIREGWSCATLRPTNLESAVVLDVQLRDRARGVS